MKTHTRRFYLCIFLVLFAALAAVFSAIRIHNLNQQYPAPSILSHALNEKFDAGSVFFCFSNGSLTRGDAFHEEFPDYQDIVTNRDGSTVRDTQYYILRTQLEIENPSDAPVQVYLGQIRAESLDWSNGIDLTLFQLQNAERNDPTRIMVEANSTVQLTLSYILYDFQFKPPVWSSIETRDFDLVLSYYPERHIVPLRDMKIR